MKHKMKIHGLFIFLLVALTAVPSLASRVGEIEEFYLTKTREFLRLRFPDKPFAVSVVVDTGREESTRKKWEREKRTSVTNLPYLDIEEEELDIWDRTDIPLETLISKLRRVEINVQIDSSMSEEDIEALQESLATTLKLDDAVDSVKVFKMEWTQLERYRTYQWVGSFIAIMLIFVFALFYILAKFSVANLVKGLGVPIREIGKSTKQFADDALSIASEMAVPGSGGMKGASFTGDAGGSIGTTMVETDELSLGSNLLEIRKNALEMIQRNIALFEHPDANFMEFLNKRGEHDPSTMGSILAELDKEKLKNLFSYGDGDWWYIAIAHPGPLTPKSISILSEVDKLRLRNTFRENSPAAKVQEKFKEEGLLFSRISVSHLSDIFYELPLDKALSMFDVLPRTKALAVAKDMYPGQWAAFLVDKKEKEELDEAMLAQYVEDASNRFPKRNETSIQKFFEELDLSLYLDSAHTRDERDFYMALPKDSNIVEKRIPFFNIFDANKIALKAIGVAISPEEWAYVLTHCEHHEKEMLLQVLPEKLSFRIHEEERKVVLGPQVEPYIRQLKRTLVAAYIEETNRSQKDVQNIIDEISTMSDTGDDKDSAA